MGTVVWVSVAILNRGARGGASRAWLVAQVSQKYDTLFLSLLSWVFQHFMKYSKEESPKHRANSGSMSGRFRRRRQPWMAGVGERAWGDGDRQDDG